MTNDSHLFKVTPAQGRLPLYEGRMMHQFTHTWNEHPPRYWIEESEAKNALRNIRRPYQATCFDFETYRIAFRGIARNTDVRSMIATVLPPKTFCSGSVTIANHPIFGTAVRGRSATTTSRSRHALRQSRRVRRSRSIRIRLSPSSRLSRSS